MKFPIAIPRGAFTILLIVLASLFGGLVGAMFALAWRGAPIPAEFGKCLLAVSGALGTLVVGPKPHESDSDSDGAVPHDSPDSN